MLLLTEGVNAVGKDSREREQLKIGRVGDLRKGRRGWSPFFIMVSGKEARVDIGAVSLQVGGH